MLLMRVLLIALLPLSLALKFDIQAHPGSESASKERCVRNFVAKDQLVVVTATVSGSRGDGQMLNMHVRIAPLYALLCFASLLSLSSAPREAKLTSDSCHTDQRRRGQRLR